MRDFKTRLYFVEIKTKFSLKPPNDVNKLRRRIIYLRDVKKNKKNLIHLVGQSDSECALLPLTWTVPDSDSHVIQRGKKKNLGNVRRVGCVQKAHTSVLSR